MASPAALAARLQTLARLDDAQGVAIVLALQAIQRGQVHTARGLLNAADSLAAQSAALLDGVAA